MKRVWLCSILLSSCALALQAQVLVHEYEVGKIRFVGNRELTDDVLLSHCQTKETPGWFWKFLGKISSKIGEEPQYFDPIVFEADLARLRQLYRDQGFFEATVDTSILELPAEKRVQLTFRIHEGRRSYIDTLAVRGLKNLPSVLVEEIDQGALIHRGDPYIVANAENELRRIVRAFANNGYVRVAVDTVIAVRYASTNNITLIFSFTPNERYSFGPITIENDTTVSERVDPSIVLRHLDFKEGDFYSEEKKTDSERNLNRLGVFEASRIEPVVADSALDSLEIPMRVLVRPRPFHELTPEVGASDENSAFNLVTGIGYSNRNFFGGARNFSTRFRISLQSIQDLNLARIIRSPNGLQDSTLISKIELSSQVVQPYFFSNKVSLSVTLAGILEKQKTYYATIYQARAAVNAQLARYTRGILEFNLERVDPRGFGDDKLPDLSSRPDLTPQFNSIITMTLQRDRRNDLFSPSEGFVHSGSIEEAGLMPRIFGGLFGSRLRYSEYVKLSGVGQWYWDAGTSKAFVWAARVRGGFAILFGKKKLTVSAAGDSTYEYIPVPITRRFYAGGSESVRGWKSRELGAVPIPNEGGNALFEANLEGRWHLFQKAGKFLFIDPRNISIVGFYDVGDVWTEAKKMRMSEIAMAAGLGFRWDTIAGPIRIDWGFRVYDPFDQSGRKWFTQRRFFHDTYGIIHFGIGHTF